MTLHWILVYRHAARTRVVRNFAIRSTSRPEGRGGGGGKILNLSRKRGGYFFKIPTFGKGLNWLKIADPPLAINNEQSLIISRDFNYSTCMRVLKSC